MSLLKNLEPFTGFQRNLTYSLDKYEHKESRIISHSDCVYGIEVETERWNARDGVLHSLDDYWNFTRDGSLRGDYAMEAISIPLRGAAVVRAVRKLCKAINVEDPFTYRCSTHIHLNLLDINTKHLPAFMLTCLLVDNLLFQAGGGARRGNYNCRPASVLMDEVELMADLSYHLSVKNDLPFGGDKGFGDRDRYLGTNFAAMFKFGTCEFRHFPGTTSARTILGWCDLIGDIYHFAQTTSVQEIMEIANDGVKAFGTEVFGDAYPTLTYREVNEDWHEALDTAFHFTTTLARVGAGRKSFHGLLQAEYVI